MLQISHRKAMYALLAQLFAYPDESLCEALRDKETHQLLGLLGCDVPPGTYPCQELEPAYTSLFINRLGGAPALPYGSLYLEPEERLLGTTTQLVAGWYTREGLRLEAAGEPPDHLPTELEFCYFLVGQEEEALLRGDDAAVRAATEKQVAFAGKLLFPWLPHFCAKIAREPSAHPLYRWAGTLLLQFCQMEGKRQEELFPVPAG